MRIVRGFSQYASVEERDVFLLSDIDRGVGAISTIGESSKNGIAAEAKEILEYINSQTSVVSFDPDYIREARRRAGNQFDYKDSEDVIRRELSIPTRNGHVLARTYTPRGMENSNNAALVYYHGGGFVLGSVESYDRLVASLSQQADIFIISVEYRLAPEYPFPAPLEDVQDSFLWLHENAGVFDIDPNKIAIGGDSAGANMAAATTILNRDSDEAMPALQLLLYPSTAANKSSKSREEFSEGYLLTSEVLEWYHGHYIASKDSDDPRFNLLETSDFSNLPPSFVLTCGFDPLRDEGELFAQKLRAAGNQVRHSCYTDMFHAFLNFGVLPQAHMALEECAAVLTQLKNLNSGGINLRAHQ